MSAKGALRGAAGVTYPEHWRTRLAAVAANEGDARLLCVGDSTTAGARGAGSTSLADSWPSKLVGLLTVDGIPAAPGILFGGPLSMVTDPRITVGALWVTTGGLPAGAQGWKGQVGGGVLSIDFADAFDEITVHHLAGPSVGGASAVNVDGGASLGTISGASPILVKLSTTFACPSGVHRINVASPTGAQLWIIGIEVRSTSTSRVLVSNAGRPGTQTAHWVSASAGTGVLQTIQEAAPDLTVVDLTINDATVPASVATVTANLLTLLGHIRSVGSDVLLVVPHPCNGANFDTWQPGYADAIRGIAAARGIAVFDVRTRAPWATYASALDAGFVVDNAHPSPTGYADLAAGIYPYIVA